MNKIIFLKATEQDLLEVASLFNIFLSELRDITKDPYFDFTDLPIGDREKRLKVNMEEHNGCVYLAKDGDQIVGFLSGVVIDCFLAVSSIEKIGYIEGAYVKSSY